jgi:DNA mismatch repair protein MutS2
VALEEIVGIESAAEQSRAGTGSIRQSTTVNAQSAGAATSDEINVIGLTVEQATELVDKFLDDAALAHRPRVRIIHGHGTGALRRGLSEFLKTHPLAGAQSFEREEHGGKAVTVVELRA